MFIEIISFEEDFIRLIHLKNPIMLSFESSMQNTLNLIEATSNITYFLKLDCNNVCYTILFIHSLGPAYNQYKHVDSVETMP